MATGEEIIYTSARCWWRATQRRTIALLPCRNKLLMRKSRNERPKKTKTNRITSSENQTYPDGWRIIVRGSEITATIRTVRYVEPAKWLWRDEGPADAVRKYFPVDLELECKGIRHANMRHGMEEMRCRSAIVGNKTRPRFNYLWTMERIRIGGIMRQSFHHGAAAAAADE